MRRQRNSKRPKKPSELPRRIEDARNQKHPLESSFTASQYTQFMKDTNEYLKAKHG
jgi:hypothetical protein